MAEALVVYGGANPPGRLRAAVGGAIWRARKRGLRPALLDLGARPVAESALAAIEAADALVFAGRFESGRLIGPLGELLERLPPSSLAGKPLAGVALHAAEARPTHLCASVPIAVHLTAADFADGTPSPAARRALDALLTDMCSRASGVQLPAKLGSAA